MSDREDLDIRRLWFVLRRRSRAVLAAALSFVALALLLTAATPSVYRASSRIQIEQGPHRSPVTGEATESPSPQSENLSLFTTAELITNRVLIERLANHLRTRGIAMANQAPAPLERALRFVVGTNRNVAAGPGRERLDADWLAAAIAVRPVRDTRLVDIQVEHSDPRQAAIIANTVAAFFIADEADRKRQAELTRLNDLKRQIDDVRQIIQSSEESLYGPHESSLAIFEGRRKQLSDALPGLNESALKARTDRMAAQDELERLRSFQTANTADWDNLPIQTPALDQLRRDLRVAETQMASARQIYRERHPTLIALQSQCAAIRENIRKELEKAAADLEGQRAALAAREAGLRRSIADNEAELSVVSDRVSRYSTLEAQLATQRELYSLLLKRSQEQAVAQTIEVPLVQLVQPATVPLRRLRPHPALNLALGILVGLLTGCGIAFTIEYLRRTIRTPRDVVQELQLPVVGIIPKRL